MYGELLCFCGICIHLSISEEDQNKQKIAGGIVSPHICIKYGRQVKHRGNEPHVLRLEECMINFSKTIAFTW